MQTLLEKIKRKKTVLEYLDEIIISNQEELNKIRERNRDEVKSQMLIILILAVAFSGSLFLALATYGTTLAAVGMFFSIIVLAPSTLGLPISLGMLMIDQYFHRKKVSDIKKLINVGILREKYETQVVKELEDSLKQNNIPQDENNNLTPIADKYIINKELETCAFNMRKLIKSKKYGKLKKYLWERYNVSSVENVEMYENMVNLYLNNKAYVPSTSAPKSKNLIRK